MEFRRRLINFKSIVSAIFFVFLIFVLIVWPRVRLSFVDGYSHATFDKDDILISLTLTRDEKYRLFVPLQEISAPIISSTLIYEDQYFFKHPGINPVSIIRGAIQSLVNPKKPFGGSTITMQLVRLSYRLNTRSLLGKLKQVVLALLVEIKFSKKEILEAYLNTAPYGANVEGVGAGSLIYFNKPALKIPKEEAISLVVLPQNPSRRWRERGKTDLDRARDKLVRSIAMREGGSLIRPRDYVGTPAEIPNFAPHFANRISELYPGRSEYHSTLDSTMQVESQRVIDKALKWYQSYGIKNSMVIVAELPNMLVRSYIGSANYIDENISGFVNGLSAKRSPGSLLKPLVYALALEQGRIIPETMLQDLPIRLSSYRPENFEKNFLGPISATQALIRSRNIPALEVFRKLSKGSFYELLVKSGVVSLRNEDHYGIALVLGGLGVSAEELAGLYGILGNDGIYNKIHFFRNDEPDKGNVAFSRETGFLIKEMLSKNPRPSTSASTDEIPWKTGTSYGSKDAWSAGIVGKYVVVIWFGNFNSLANANLVGRDIAGPVFFTLAESLKRLGAGSLNNATKNLNLKKVQVCAVTGALPNENCNTLKESWFIRGMSPIEKCSLHQKIFIDPLDGLRVCPGSAMDNAEEHVYEVWDSGMQELFKSAGLNRNLPPNYKPSCELRNSIRQQSIRIISPEEHLEYFLEPHRPLELEFLASVSGEAKVVSWFVDDVLIGQKKATEGLRWSAKAGKFRIRAVDNLGNIDLKVIRISTLTE